MSESRLFIAGQATGHTITETASSQKPAVRKVEVIPAPAVVLTEKHNQEDQDNNVPPAPPVVLAKPEEGDGT